MLLAKQEKPYKIQNYVLYAIYYDVTTFMETCMKPVTSLIKQQLQNSETVREPANIKFCRTAIKLKYSHHFENTKFFFHFLQISTSVHKGYLDCNQQSAQFMNINNTFTKKYFKQGKTAVVWYFNC